MSHSLSKVFADSESRSGVLGVAIGRKEVQGAPTEDEALTFFVAQKEARRGSARRLPSGKRLLPSRVTLGDRTMLTDVVAAPPPEDESGTGRVQRTSFTGGGPVSNAGEMGTFGCIVRIRGARYSYALTNQHVALGVNSIVFFPSAGAANAVGAVTRRSVDLVPDEEFSVLLDSPNAYFDVDAALVQIPEAKKARFSTRIPTLGTPDSIFQPDVSSVDAYRASLIGKRVSSWCWNSGRNDGEISHVFYTTRLPRFNVIGIYSFLVRGDDGSPSSPRDSGKVWVAPTAGGGLELVGLHQAGVTPTPGAARHAVATEMAGIAKLLNIAPRVAL